MKTMYEIFEEARERGEEPNTEAIYRAQDQEMAETGCVGLLLILFALLTVSLYKLFA